MTYQNLLKWKEYYEKKNDKKNLEKVLKNLAKYETLPEEEKVKKTK